MSDADKSGLLFPSPVVSRCHEMGADRAEAASCHEAAWGGFSQADKEQLLLTKDPLCIPRFQPSTHFKNAL